MRFLTPECGLNHYNTEAQRRSSHDAGARDSLRFRNDIMTKEYISSSASHYRNSIDSGDAENETQSVMFLNKEISVFQLEIFDGERSVHLAGGCTRTNNLA
jgi:hypothetical protein